MWDVLDIFHTVGGDVAKCLKINISNTLSDIILSQPVTIKSCFLVCGRATESCQTSIPLLFLVLSASDKKTPPKLFDPFG